MRDPNRTAFVARKVENEDVGRRCIGRNGNRVNVTNLEQCLDVWFVRMSGQRIAKEDDRIDVTFDDARADLHVAAFRTGRHTFAAELYLALQEQSGRLGRKETESFEQPSVRSAQPQQLILLGVVRDKGDERSVG
jgi:hypothetical protein